MARAPQRITSLPRLARGLAAALLLALLWGDAAQAAAPAVRGNEVLVRYRGTGELARIPLRAGLDPRQVARALRAQPELFATAGPNLIARAAAEPTAVEALAAPPLSAQIEPPAGLAGWIPNDVLAGVPWQQLQWNFVGRHGIAATRAWDALRRRGSSRSGGRGVRIAVVDTGLAYRDRAPYVATPDLPRARVEPGYDFVDEDRFPDDESGHGTHVASTIAAQTGDGTGLTGVAYAATIVPIRVLDSQGTGDVLAISRGIRYAIRRKVDLINLSVDFPPSVTMADIPEVSDALTAARKAGILVIASSGNDGIGKVALPAREPSVLAVGATTVRGCRSAFSNAGAQLALVAPGGGRDHPSERDRGACTPSEGGPSILQITLAREGTPGTLGLPLDYVGTSMAAAHVTGVAALVLGSRVLGNRPSPDLLAAYLVRSTRDRGDRGRDSRYGAGLIDAYTATSKRGAAARVRGARRAVAVASQARARALPIR